MLTINAMDELVEIYESRPFKTQNADEYDLGNILDLFVDPTKGLRSPFDYENAIIKGGMGAGKTMYLRANHAYYISRLVPSLLDQEGGRSNENVILPIYIRLSDFQNIRNPEEIYKKIIIKILDELLSIRLHLEDSENLSFLHKGIISLPTSTMISDKIIASIQRQSAEEYIEKVTTGISLTGSVAAKFLNLSAGYDQQKGVEIRKKPDPSISDIEQTYNAIIKPYGGKILLLFDEAGSLTKDFFSENERESLFEILMNQLRTCNFIKTKVAIYPKHASDILAEARYGKMIELEENVLDESGYESFRGRVIALAEKYIENSHSRPVLIETVFRCEPTQKYGDTLEQIIYASGGNMRRLVYLLDSCMDIAYTNNHGRSPVSLDDVKVTLSKHGQEMERLYLESEVDLLNALCTTCRTRSTYRFTYAGKANILAKFTTKSEEYNLLRVIEPGTGRKSTVFEFDYAYCVYKELPTHYISGTEAIERKRSLIEGVWIRRVTNITLELIEQANIDIKIEGSITLRVEGGFSILGDDDRVYIAPESNVISLDKNKSVYVQRRVRFIPADRSGTLFAAEIEII